VNKTNQLIPKANEWLTPSKSIKGSATTSHVGCTWKKWRSERSLVGVEITELAHFVVNVVDAILIPQAERVVVQVSRIALEDTRPLRFPLVNDGSAEVHVEEAGVVTGLENTSGSRIGGTDPNIHPSTVKNHATGISDEGLIDVDFVDGFTVVHAAEERNVSIRRSWDIGTESAEFSFGKVITTRKAWVGSKGDVGPDLDILHQVACHRRGLVHLEVQELEFSAVIEVVRAEGVGKPTSGHDSWRAIKGHRDICADRRDDRDHRNIRWKRGDCRNQDGG